MAPRRREQWLRGFEHLSAESRYRRFLTPVPEIALKLQRYLTELDR